MTESRSKTIAEGIKTGGYEVIEVNISDSTESLYAVCTPVKK
ncbi:hypothetical protein [Oceanobacillus massiliensis]|nr:hypothetical protein [Oceanobacillus massiliensis]